MRRVTIAFKFQGLGEERLLMVHGVAFRGTPEMEVEVAAVAARKRAPVAVRDRARQIWRWCQVGLLDGRGDERGHVK